MPFISIKVLKDTSSNEKSVEMIKKGPETVADIEASPSLKDGLVHYPWGVIE